MRQLGAIMTEQWVQPVGWTLVHFIWQGILAAVLLWGLLRTFRKASSAARYWMACLGLLTLACMPIATFMHVYEPQAKISASAPIQITQPQSIPQLAPESVVMNADPAPLPLQSIKEVMIGKIEAALPVCVLGWIVGVAALSLWYLGGWCQLQKLRRIGTKSVPQAIEAKAAQLAARLGIARVVRIVESALVQVPTVIGVLKPIILLPTSALTGLPPEQLSALIAHELAHIKRCDYLINILQTIVEILGFYHPALWWMSRQIRIERENGCDDMAVALLQNKKDYAGALFTMAQIRHRQLELAVAANGGHLTNRISRLASKESSPRQKTGWTASVIAILLIAGLLITTSIAMSNKPVAKEGEMDPVQTRVYQVNRTVSDFLETEDFSTPETAYAAINRVMAADEYDVEGWQRVSIKGVSIQGGKKRSPRKVDPQWAKVVLNARILEVRICDDQAVVIAEFPQDLSDKPIREPIDYRHLNFEDGKWLNTGENRYDTIQQARDKFDQMLEKDLIAEEQYTNVLDKKELFQETAEELFDKLQKADYQKVLSYYDEQTGKWRKDGWKKLDLDYCVHTNWPSFALWVCRTFKDNPIQSVELGEPFISDTQLMGQKQNAPAIPYTLTLKDGIVLKGDLTFAYRANSKKWQPTEGIDWHLQENPISRFSLHSPEVDYSSVTVQEGVGFEDIVFGCTGDHIKSKLGEPDKEVHNEKDWWLNYRKTYGLGFWVNPKEDFLIEIRLNQGFKGQLSSGISMVSTKQEVFDTYGEPIKQEVAKDFDQRYDNQVLLYRSGVIGKFKPAKIHYNKDGLLFWFKGDKIVQIVASGESAQKVELAPSSTVNAQGHIEDKVDYPFVNDPQVVGGWKSVDFVSEPDQFNPDKKNWKGDLYLKEMHFLENGKTNWAFSWTKGLILHSGDKTAAQYHIREINGDQYLFMQWKSGDYTIRHRKPSWYVLKKDDSLVYVESRTVDNIDYPFVTDPQVLGCWQSVDFVNTMDEFQPGKMQWKGGDLFHKEMIFRENGDVILKNKKVPNGYNLIWTRGLVIHKSQQTASKYVVKRINNADYLFYEWKSGDYIFRHAKPSYYVLKRAAVPSTGSLEKKDVISVEARFLLLPKALIEELGQNLKLSDIFEVKDEQAGTPFLDDVQSQFIIRATQAYESAKMVTSPKVVVYDNETAELAVTQTKQFTNQQGEIEDIDTGTQLKVTPHLTPKGHILTEIEYKYTDLLDEVKGVSVTSSVATKATVPDGGTILMGPSEIKKEGEPTQRLYCMVKVQKCEESGTVPAAVSTGGGSGVLGGGFIPPADTNL